MEVWDVYDSRRNITGRTMERGRIADGDYHLVIHVCLFNSRGEMLIQKRQPFRECWPGMWDLTVGGSAVAGETSQQTAERELFEEVGIKADFRFERPLLTVHFSHGFDDYYLLETNIDPANLSLQYEEVEKVGWSSCKELLQLIENGSFIPYYVSFIELLFEMRGERGEISKSWF